MRNKEIPLPAALGLTLAMIVVAVFVGWYVTNRPAARVRPANGGAASGVVRRAGPGQALPAERRTLDKRD